MSPKDDLPSEVLSAILRDIAHALQCQVTPLFPQSAHGLVSELRDWKTVRSGMLKLYEGEVLNKLPVVQHLVFGSLIRCTWTPSSTIHLPTPPPHAIPTSFPVSSLPGSGSFSGAAGVRHHGSSIPPPPLIIFLSSFR